MIELRSVTVEYDGLTVLEELTLTIEDGEFVLLAGVNGSGKTTLCRLCNGLLVPDSGTVAVDGVPVREDPLAARTRVGMVFQHPRDQFVASTVGADVAFGPENLGLSRPEIDERVSTVLAAVGMTGREDDRLESLSGGEQSRVAIAGALAMRPNHLLLDEPFAGLDYPSRRSVLEHVEGLAERGTGVVVATHDLRDVLEPADRLLVLEDGRITIDDDPDRALEDLDGESIRIPSR